MSRREYIYLLLNMPVLDTDTYVDMNAYMCCRVEHICATIIAYMCIMTHICYKM